MGGSKPSEPQYIQPPPPQIIPSPVAPPNAGETAGQLAQTQLQYNPQLSQQAFDLYSQFSPQYQQQAYQQQQQYGPMYKALQDQLYPQQAQNLQTLATQAGQRFASPQGLTPEQQAAQDAIRQRAYQESDRGVREAANVGGTLYGGRRELREDRARNELSQGFATQDIQLQDQLRAQALQELIAASQVNNPQIAQVNPPQFTQSVTPSADSLLQAIMGAQSQFIVNPSQYQPGNPGTPGYFQSFARGMGGQPGQFY